MSDSPSSLESPELHSGLRARSLLISGGVFLLFVAILVAVIVIARETSDPGTPPRPAEFVAPAGGNPTVVFDVQQVSDAGVITFAGEAGVAEGLEIPPSAAVEVLQPVALSDLQPGQQISVIGIPNQVRNFVITAVVAFAGDTTRAPGDAGVRSLGGFEGWEAFRDRSQRVVLSGTVTSVSRSEVTFEGATGPVSISLTDNETAGRPPVYVLRQGTASEIRSGWRVAFPAAPDGSADPSATAVLAAPN